MTQFSWKNLTYRPQIHSFFSSAVSFSPKSVEQLISSEPAGVITRAAITRAWRRHTHSLEARQQRSRQRCLWIQISMQTLCPDCRTKAAESSSIWVTLVKWFARQALGVITPRVGHSAGLQGPVTCSCWFAFMFDLFKAKKKKNCCVMISITPIGDLNIY